MLEPLYKYGSSPHFYRLSARLTPWLAAIAGLLFIVGLAGALYFSPPDYQQGQSVRIMYVHVPSAWMSMFVYMVMAGAGLVGLVWKVKVADAVARASAPLGAAFTFLALCTGSLWGKPMWGTWWVWDARLTSELILFFLYLGYLALQSAIDDRRAAARAGGILALVGVINIPIIHYSVVWWNTLHQGSSFTKFGKPTIEIHMLIPLLVMTLAYMTYYAATVLIRARCELLELEPNSTWVSELAARHGTAGP